MNTSAAVKARDGLLLHVGERARGHPGDPGRPGDPVPPGSVPRALGRAGDRPQADDLARRVPRPRGHPSVGHRRVDRERSRGGVHGAPGVRLREPGDGVRRRATHILSTERHGQLREGALSSASSIATETGIIHRLKKDAPGEDVRGRQRAGGLPVHEDDHAREDARRPARLEVRGQVDPEIVAKAKLAIDRMVAIG